MAQKPTQPGDSKIARNFVAAIDAKLGQAINVLDHGFVRVIDYMGDDQAVVQAARVSYGRGTKSVSEDQSLINYLLRHRHNTPFEMCVIKFHIKMPIFVARQWIRHRTASVNEYSARYSLMGSDYYLPAPEQLQAQSTSNRQGRADELAEAEAASSLATIRNHAEKSYGDYQFLHNESEDGTKIDPTRQGLSRELARMVLPLNYYTEWYWSINLHNLMHFLELRLDQHAQYEIRVYADAIYTILKDWVPMTAAAFAQYRLQAVTLSPAMLKAFAMLVKGEQISEANTGLSKRELKEVQQLFDQQSQ